MYCCATSYFRDALYVCWSTVKIEWSPKYHFLFRFGSGSGTIWLDDVGCTGSESCLLSCSNRGIGSNDCSHSEDVAIYCYGSRSSSLTDCSTGKFSNGLTQASNSVYVCMTMYVILPAVYQCVLQEVRCLSKGLAVVVKTL